MPELVQKLSLENVIKAASNLEHKVLKTPVHQFPLISHIVNKAVFQGQSPNVQQIELFFKCENQQNINSKFRGLTNYVSLLTDKVLQRGLVAYSTGNHALSLATACKLVSKEKGITIPVVVVLPKRTSQSKIDRIQECGAKVICFGDSVGECLEVAQNIHDAAGMILARPTGHPHIVLGQGAVTLEFLQQVKDELDSREESDDSSDDPWSDDERPCMDLLITPSAGSGLLAGAALACQDTGVMVMGVEPKDEGVKKHIAAAPAHSTDSSDMRNIIAEHNWDVVRNSPHVGGIFTVRESDIRTAMKLFMKESKMEIEQSGALALAALLFNKGLQRRIAKSASACTSSPLRIGVMVSGGNPALERLLEKPTRSAKVQCTLPSALPSTIPSILSRPRIDQRLLSLRPRF